MYINMCIYIYMFIYIYIYIYMYTYIYMYIYIYIHIHTYTCVYIYIYMLHTYICMSGSSLVAVRHVPFTAMLHPMYAFSSAILLLIRRTKPSDLQARGG